MNKSRWIAIDRDWRVWELQCVGWVNVGRVVEGLDCNYIEWYQ